MASFSNGTEGMDYQEKWCSRCVHEHDCPVWLAHLSFNSDQHKDQNLKDCLEMLIPMKDKIWPDKCKMFVEAE